VALLDDDSQVRLAAIFALVRLPVAERWYNFPDQWALVSSFGSKSPPTLDQYLERYDDMEFDRSPSEAASAALEGIGVTSDDPEFKAASLRFASALRGKHGLHYIYAERAVADEHDAVVAAGFIIARKLHPDSISPKMVARTIGSLKSSSPLVREAASAFFPNVEAHLLIKHVDDLELLSYQSEDQSVRWAVQDSLRKLYPILDQMQAENRTAAP
jgi:hypothetical protein